MPPFYVCVSGRCNAPPQKHIQMTFAACDVASVDIFKNTTERISENVADSSVTRIHRIRVLVFSSSFYTTVSRK